METPTPLQPVPSRRQRPRGFTDLGLADLTAQVEELGYPAYRARQLYEWAYQHLAGSYDEMRTVPADLRAALAGSLPLTTLAPVQEIRTDNGDTVKMLTRTADGHLVETVLMLYPDRATVCVSCQVGCAVGCAFCATGLGGLARNLTAGEMVAQVVDAARRAREAGRQLTNLVMMGMGEPFHNYDATMAFIRIINDPAGMGFGARRITISTAGVIPMIDKLADEPLQVNLAVSLHTPFNDQRDELVPHNRRYPVADLVAACQRYIAKTGRRVSFEYALMRGINDSDETAVALGDLLRGMLCHLNLIPFNPVEVLQFERPDPAGIERFAGIVREAGIPVTVRYSRGVEIAAACGQLRHKQQALEASASS